MSSNAATIHKRLRAEAAGLLRLDPDKLSALEALQCDLCGTLMLEIDAIQAVQLSGQGKVDIGKLSDLVRLLRSLLPAAVTEVQSSHEFDGALEMFARIVNARRGAIAARETHLSELLTKEVEELKAANAELRNQLETARYLELRPTEPSRPLPKPAAPTHVDTSVPGGPDLFLVRFPQGHVLPSRALVAR